MSHKNRVKQLPSWRLCEPCVNREIRRVSLLNQLSHQLSRRKRKKPALLLNHMMHKNHKSQQLFLLNRMTRMNRETSCQLLQSLSEQQHPLPNQEPDHQIPSS